MSLKIKERSVKSAPGWPRRFSVFFSGGGRRPGGGAAVGERINAPKNPRRGKHSIRSSATRGTARGGFGPGRQDAEPGARINAILALRKIGGPEALNGRWRRWPRNTRERIQAVNALGQRPGSPGQAEDIARNPDKDLRISAVMALSRLNDTQTQR